MSSGEYDPHISVQSANTDGYVIVKSTAPPSDSTDGEQSEGDPQSATTKGDPVDLASGHYIERWVEAVIPGTIPLVLTRTYKPGSGLDGPLGKDRISPLDVFIVVDERNRLILRDEEGRRIVFDRPFNFLPAFNTAHRHLALRAPWLKELELEDGRLLKHFRRGRDGVYRLFQVKDPHGNRIDYKRDEKGRLVEALHSDGYSLAFDDDGSGLRKSVNLWSSEASMRIAAYTYDARRNMVEAACPTGSSITYAYDKRDRLVSWQDRRGRTRTDFDHDDGGRVARTATTGTWNNDVFRYDGTSAVYRPGSGAGEERSVFDARGQLISETGATGATKRFAHASGYLVSAVDEAGRVERFTWDHFGNPTMLTDRVGRRHLWRWIAPGSPTIAIDATGSVRKFSYDGNGNLLGVTDPCGVETTFEWTEAGRIASIADPIGVLHRYFYDEAHRLVRHVDAAGAETSYARDDRFGRVTKVTNPAGGRIFLKYDETGSRPFLQPTSATYSNGARFDLGFDEEGQPSSVSQADGRTVAITRGAFDVVTSAIDPDGAQLRFEYDGRGLPSKVTNAVGRAYLYERDPAGKVVATTDFDGHRTTFELDACGRTTRRINADGSEVAFAYDRCGLMVGRTWKEPGNGGEVSESFEYDAAGGLASAQNADGRIVIVRDRAGRVLEESNDHSTIVSEIDARGRRTSRRIGEDFANFAYDQADRPTLMGMRHGQTRLEVSFVHDRSGRQVAREAGAFKLEQAYDPFGRLLGQTFGRPAEIFRRSYRWSSTGELNGVSETLWGGSSFQHDRCGRVVEARYGEGLPAAAPAPDLGLLGMPDELLEVLRFAYDAAGNIVASDTAGPGEPLGRPLTAWRLSSGGRAETVRGRQGETITFKRDGAGRVVERTIEKGKVRQVWTFRWNAVDRLVASVTPEGREWRYAYDPLGRRIASFTDGVVRRFVWDGDAIAGEMDGDGHLSTSWLRCPTSGQVLACRLGENFLHVVTDHLGTPREMFATGGDLAWAARHDLWFACRDVRVGVRGSCRLAFPGQIEDVETGLLYNRHRYFDPASAQFLTSDPTGLAGGTRIHGYVDNPLTMSDPLGLSPNVLGTFGSGAAGGLTNLPGGPALGFAGTSQQAMTPGQISAWGLGFMDGQIGGASPTGGIGLGAVPGEQAASLEGVGPPMALGVLGIP